MRRGAREGKHMRTHALPPSLLPSPLAHRAPAKSRDLVAPPPPGESTRRAAWSEFPPPPCCLARRPPPSPSSRRSLSPFGVVRFPLVRSPCCHFGGSLPAGQRAGRVRASSAFALTLFYFSPSLPLLRLCNRDVVAGKRFLFSGIEAWDLRIVGIIKLTCASISTHPISVQICSNKMVPP